MMTCADVQENLRLYLLGECEPDSVSLVETHLEECSACRESRERVQPIVEQLDRDLVELLEREPRSRQRILQRLDEEAVPRRSRFRWAAPLGALAAGLLLAIGAYFWTGGRQPPSDPVAATHKDETPSAEKSKGFDPIAPAHVKDKSTASDPKRTPPIDPVRPAHGRYAKTVLSDGTILWAAADARWHEKSSRDLELTEGELFVEVARAPQPFKINTPAGLASARGTAFFIDVRKPAPTLPKGEPKVNVLKRIVLVTVLSGLVTLSHLSKNVTGSRGEVLYADEASPPKKQVEDLALRFAKHYQPVKVTTSPSIPAYALPLDVSKVANFQAAAANLGLGAGEPSLKANGFVVLPNWGEDIVAPYETLKKRQIPIFVTADTLLHLYHVQFDETLKDIEEREFHKDIVALSEMMVQKLDAMALPAEDENFREARRKALTFFAIGLKALKPEAKLPASVSQEDVDVVLVKMKNHEGFDAADGKSPLFRYAEDFSQYVPRGHYTRSETLKKYFVGMMWFGRMTFLLKGHQSYGPDASQPALVSIPEAAQQTIAAALTTKLLEQAKLADGRSAREVWERIYAVTSFYVGLSDDLGLPQYKDSLVKVCGTALDLSQLADGKQMFALKVELAKHNPPAIYSGTGSQSINFAITPNPGPEELDKILHKTTGFRFMGQRFVPDSHMMSKMVFPTVGRGSRADVFTAFKHEDPSVGILRVFPRGLDVMTLLGSNRAREIIRELGDDSYGGDDDRPGHGALKYDSALDALRKEYAGLSEADWNRNLNWSWLHALKPLLAEHGEGYQSFMTTQAYRTKSLNTALASWAQLRHDTILYAKQSYTPTAVAVSAPAHPPKPPKPVQGYVEPIPEFYARLLTLARMSNKGLTEMKVLDATAVKRLDALEKLLARLLAISEKELANEELKETDYEFIRHFGANLEAVVVTDSKPRPMNKRGETETSNSMKTTLIADVHTDQNTSKCLEEGTGYVDLGVFVYKQPDGRLVLGAGPVLSYYEFKHPMKDRLTDEKWRDILKGKTPPAQPEWTKEYRSSKAMP